MHGKQLAKHITSGARSNGLLNISRGRFFGVEIPTPLPSEQQKIADCLASLDELIAAESEQLDALKAHKKGLMQQLFPREGETTPRLRFPEFKDTSKWAAKAIGSLCKTFSGGTPSTSNPNYYGGEIPFIRSAEIGKNQTELFLTNDGLINSAAKLIDRGDVLVALYGANSGDVSLAKINGAINQAILCLKSKACNGYIYQYLSFQKDWITSTYLQGGQGNLSGEIIKSIEIPIPSLHEQQRIANCLSSLDDQIAVQSEKVDALKEHKKGLLQQLFPIPEEIDA
ncbi:restriction endonuclease subunit S [Ruficoccus amylovorans]|uniref:Restriction endonuclease subunit S n=2 Tax=Ruficoccus amylovorans TaxID=1804625 RepID=A0A842H8Q8_9BACT|nr:restriction endonuclease subunit S [Ruficoccus amylovorans]MBC2592772.1 restriction endonuclease subunit S [Ruficoccus amylovorans]